MRARNAGGGASSGCGGEVVRPRGGRYVDANSHFIGASSYPPSSSFIAAMNYTYARARARTHTQISVSFICLCSTYKRLRAHTIYIPTYLTRVRARARAHERTHARTHTRARACSHKHTHSHKRKLTLSHAHTHLGPLRVPQDLRHVARQREHPPHLRAVRGSERERAREGGRALLRV